MTGTLERYASMLRDRGVAADPGQAIHPDAFGRLPTLIDAGGAR